MWLSEAAPSDPWWEQWSLLTQTLPSRTAPLECSPIGYGDILFGPRGSMAGTRSAISSIAALTPEQYRVTQKSGTERPGTGALLNNKEPGIYVDVVSGEPLFAGRLNLQPRKPGTGAHVYSAAAKRSGQARAPVL